MWLLTWPLTIYLSYMAISWALKKIELKLEEVDE
jgi:hypothetical protein